MHAYLERLISRPIAHRGLHACGHDGPVENSIGAAQAAVAGDWGIECDVQLSRDGEAMVFHDDDLARLTGEKGRLVERDAAELCALTLIGNGERVPRLQDLLGAIGGRVPLVIEIKSDDSSDMRLAARTLALVGAYRGVVAIESFDPAVVLHCRAHGATCPVGLVGPPDAPASVDPRALAASDFLSWSIEDLADAAALRPDLPLTTWTVRTAAHVERAHKYAAQIVFEGFDPTPFINDAEKEDRGLSL